VLVSDLLASSRVDFTALTRTKLDAVQVGATALERASIDLGKLEAPAEPAVFEGDATLVARAVSNLLENAKRHAGGVATLRIETRPNAVAFIVEDDGPGFEPGEEGRVFEPFYKRASHGKNGEESVGLGLALVKKIAEAHQGSVFASNRPEGGARVGVEFARLELVWRKAHLKSLEPFLAVNIHSLSPQTNHAAPGTSADPCIFR